MEGEKIKEVHGRDGKKKKYELRKRWNKKEKEMKTHIMKENGVFVA